MVQIRIETERCTIRFFKPADVEAFMSYRNNLEWMKYQGLKGRSKSEYEKVLLGPADLYEGVQLAVADRQTDVLIGDLYVRREADTYWIGYTIAPEHARRGYAGEAVLSFTAYLKAKGAVRVKAGVQTGNEPSAALLRKLGFTYLGTEEDEQIFGLNFDGLHEEKGVRG